MRFSRSGGLITENAATSYVGCVSVNFVLKPCHVVDEGGESLISHIKGLKAIYIEYENITGHHIFIQAFPVE